MKTELDFCLDFVDCCEFGSDCSNEFRELQAQQVKAKLQQQGISIAQWAADRGVERDLAYRLLNGRSVGLRGKTHEAAVKLGIKPVPAKSHA